MPRAQHDDKLILMKTRLFQKRRHGGAMVTPGTAAQFKNLTASGTPYDKAQTQVGTADQLQMVLMDAGILTEEGRDLNSKL